MYFNYHNETHKMQVEIFLNFGKEYLELFQNEWYELL